MDRPIETLEYEKPQVTISFESKGKKFVNFVVNSDTIPLIKAQDVDVESILKKEIKKRLNSETDRFFYGYAKKRGDYLNFGEIIHDASEGDSDAQYLLKLYDAIWDAEEQAENEIDQLSDLNQLLKILQDVPGYLLPKLEEAKQKLDTSLSSQTSTTGAQQ